MRVVLVGFYEAWGEIFDSPALDERFVDRFEDVPLGVGDVDSFLLAEQN